MMIQADKKEIYDALETMCAHSLFSNSSIYTRLLRYLVEKAIAQEDIKEYTIGNDLFGKNYLNDKNDGTVRTYMYTLRKKLTAYYSEKSNDDAIIFEIKKGQYNLSFASRNNLHSSNDTPSINIPFTYLIVTAVLILISLLILTGRYIYSTQVPQPWKGYFCNDAKNLVVISDQYVIMEKNQHGEKHATMYQEINSAEDLFEYKNEHPDRIIDNTDFTVMSKMAPYGVKTLYSWFIEYKGDFDLELESKLNYKHIQNNNLIFIGQYKTMNLSKSFFLKNSQHFVTYRDGYKYLNEDDEKIYNTEYGNSSKIEYAMVSFTSLSNGKHAFYFVSNNDIGVLATLRNFTNKKWLKEFYTQIPSSNAHFNALFKVSGLQRTDISCELVKLEIIKTN